MVQSFEFLKYPRGNITQLVVTQLSEEEKMSRHKVNQKYLIADEKNKKEPELAIQAKCE